MFGNVPGSNAGLGGRKRPVYGLKVECRGARAMLALFFWNRRLRKFVRWGSTDFGTTQPFMSDGADDEGMSEEERAHYIRGGIYFPDTDDDKPKPLLPLAWPYPGPNAYDRLRIPDLDRDGGLVSTGGDGGWPWYMPDGFALFNRSVLGTRGTDKTTTTTGGTGGQGSTTVDSSDKPNEWTDKSLFIDANWNFGASDQHQVLLGISLDDIGGYGGSLGYQYEKELNRDLSLVAGIKTYFQEYEAISQPGGTGGQGGSSGGGGPGGPGGGGGPGGPGGPGGQGGGTSTGGSTGWGTEVGDVLFSPPEIYIGSNWYPTAGDAYISFRVGIDTEGDTYGGVGVGIGF